MQVVNWMAPVLELNHGMVEVRQDLWRWSRQPPAQSRITTSAGCSGLSPGVFWIYLKMETRSLSGQPVPVFYDLHSKKLSLSCLNRVSCISIHALWARLLSVAPSQTTGGNLLYSFLLGISRHQDPHEPSQGWAIPAYPASPCMSDAAIP